MALTVSSPSRIIMTVVLERKLQLETAGQIWMQFYMVMYIYLVLWVE